MSFISAHALDMLNKQLHKKVLIFVNLSIHRMGQKTQPSNEGSSAGRNDLLMKEVKKEWP